MSESDEVVKHRSNQSKSLIFIAQYLTVTAAQLRPQWSLPDGFRRHPRSEDVARTQRFVTFN